MASVALLAVLVACGKHESAAPGAAAGSAARPTVVADAAAAASVPVDGPVDAPAGPVDVASLGYLAPPEPGTPAVEVIAVDAKVAWLMRELQGEARAPFWLAITDQEPLTGRVGARSIATAYETLAHARQTRAITKPAPGHGATLDLDFVGAPQRDLLALAGDVARVNIIAGPGALPDVDVRAKRIPATSVIEALAQLDDRSVLRKGSTWYFLARDAHVPEVPSLPKRKVRLDIRNGTAADAFAALRAVSGATLSACDGAPLSLRFRGDATEAARAILVTGNASLSDQPCRLDETATVDSKTDHLLATARTEKVAVAVIERGKAHLLVRASPTSTPPLDIGDSYVSAGNTSLTLLSDPGAFPTPPPDYAAWLADLHRTVAVMRFGKRWIALVAAGSDRFLAIDPEHWPGYWPFTAPRPTIDERGVHFADPGGGSAATVTIPLSH